MSANVSADGVASILTLQVASATVPVDVHPLALLNMTDEAARVDQLNKAPGAQQRTAFGILMGTSGKETAVHTCADFITNVDASGSLKCNWAQAAKRVDMIRQVLPSYDVVGFYATGAGISKNLATQIAAEFVRAKPKLEQSNICPRPVLLVLDTKPAATYRGVPLFAFELAIAGGAAAGAGAPGSPGAAVATQQDGAAAAGGEEDEGPLPPPPQITRIEYKFVSEETERIATQQSASAEQTVGNWVGPAANRFSGAVGNLQRRVEVIAQYLRAVDQGKIAPDAELLRRIKQCATKLPRPDDAIELRGLLAGGVEDAVASTIVSLMTKGSLGFAQLVEDTSLSIETEQRVFTRTGH